MVRHSSDQVIEVQPRLPYGERPAENRPDEAGSTRSDVVLAHGQTAEAILSSSGLDHDLGFAAKNREELVGSNVAFILRTLIVGQLVLGVPGRDVVYVIPQCFIRPRVQHKLLPAREQALQHGREPPMKGGLPFCHAVPLNAGVPTPMNDPTSQTNADDSPNTRVPRAALL